MNRLKVFWRSLTEYDKHLFIMSNLAAVVLGVASALLIVELTNSF